MTHRIERRVFLKTSAAAALAVPAVLPSAVFGRLAPSNRIHIGQIGCGRIARTHDLPDTLRFPEARVAAVCDVDSKRLGEAQGLVAGLTAARGGADATARPEDVAAYADYRELLRHPDLDAVMISTPDHWHAQPAIEAMRLGKDVYLQKPASLTVAEGRLLADTAARTGRILQIGSQQRSMPQFRKACELVRNGRVGALRRIVIGLPVDPPGAVEPEMPVPPNLDYDRWLGSTPVAYYTEKRVHPQADYSRPGWLRCEPFGAGMITGWGAHHFDTANWGMGTEYTGPVEVEARAEFPKSGLWDVHGPFWVTARFANGVTLEASDRFPNGVRFEGDEGWIFVTRGDYAATASDPVSRTANARALEASDPRLLSSPLPPDAVRLHACDDQHGDWLESVRTRRPPVAPAEAGHRACTACLVSHAAMKLGRRLFWDPDRERFLNDDGANALLARPQRHPYGTSFIG